MEELLNLIRIEILIGECLTMKPSHGLFIPLEVVKREYTSKLLISAYMAAKGMPVFIGHKSPIIKLALNSGQPGVFFYKSAYSFNTNFMDLLKQKGFVLVAQDEEAGIVFSDFSNMFNRRLSLKNAGMMDQFYCWGEDDFNFISNLPSINKDPLKLTGSPRTSMWGKFGYEYFLDQISYIKQKYGEYYLFVSKFSAANSYLSNKGLLKLKTNRPSWNEEEKISFNKRVEFNRRMITLFVKAADALAKNSGKKVVIRPHPAEKIATWEVLTEGMENVAVEPHGDITPWILGAKGVIQNGCTSGIEAACANIPVIALGETEDDLKGVANEIPNMLSVYALGVSDLLDKINIIEDLWEKKTKQRKSIISRKVCNAGTLQPVYDIAKNIFSLTGDPNPRGNENLGSDRCLCNLREIYRMSNLRRKSTATIMDQQKRPTLHLNQIQSDLNKMLTMFQLDCMLEVKRVAPNSYRIARVL